MQVPIKNNIYQSQREETKSRKVNWWLRLTSSGWDKPQETIEQREKMRRSQLLAWIVLGVSAAMLAFIPAAYKDTPSLVTVVIAFVMLSLIIFLNRKGWVTLAGILLVMLSIVSALGIILGAPGGEISLIYLPAYDFEVLPVIIGVSILPRMSAFVIAAIDIALIYADLLMQKHTQDLQTAINQYGIPVLAGRPTAIILITAVIAYLWVRGMDRAVRRADRAEELRSLEQYLSQVEAEHTERVKEFVQEIINAISTQANGHEGLLLLPPGHPWEAQAAFINTQLRQFHKLKQSNRGANNQLLFSAETLLRLLQHIQTGQAPLSALDPRRFTTQVPVTDEIAKYIYFMLHQALQAQQIQQMSPSPERKMGRSFYNLPGQSTQE
ncbi:MAG TPA: hypothetical protein VF458_03340 [Ktedonobacteraceae bacterium]